MSLVSIKIVIRRHQAELAPLFKNRVDMILVSQQFSLSTEKERDLLHSFVKLIEQHRSSVSVKDIS